MPNESLFTPGSPTFNRFLQKTTELCEQAKVALPEELQKTLSITLGALPRLIYQLEQEFKVDNPNAGFDLKQLLAWQVKKGYFPFDLAPELKDPKKLEEFLYCIWVTLLLSGSLEKIKTVLAQKLQNANITKEDLLDSFLKMAGNSPFGVGFNFGSDLGFKMFSDRPGEEEDDDEDDEDGE